MTTNEEENIKRAFRKGRLIDNCTLAGLLVGGALCVVGVIYNAEYNCKRPNYATINCDKPWDMSPIYAGLGVAGATIIASVGYSIHGQKKAKKSLDDALRQI